MNRVQEQRSKKKKGIYKLLDPFKSKYSNTLVALQPKRNRGIVFSLQLSVVIALPKLLKAQPLFRNWLKEWDKKNWESTWKIYVNKSKLLSAKHTHHPKRSMRCFIRSVSKVFCSPKTECVLQFTRLWYRNSLRPSTMYGTKRSIALQRMQS